MAVPWSASRRTSRPVYRPRQPRQSPLYRTIERYLPEFERTYDERYAKRYGPWRPIIGEVVRRFLRCGDLHFGFARVRCPDCAPRNVRPLLLPPAVPLPELPPEADAAGRRDRSPTRSVHRSLTARSSSPFPNACGSTAATTAACSAIWPAPLG